MSYGTSDSTVISPITIEARNLNAIDASAAQRDDSSPATIPTTTPENRQYDMFPTPQPQNWQFMSPARQAATLQRL